MKPTVSIPAPVFVRCRQSCDVERLVGEVHLHAERALHQRPLAHLEAAQLVDDERIGGCDRAGLLRACGAQDGQPVADRSAAARRRAARRRTARPSVPARSCIQDAAAARRQSAPPSRRLWKGSRRASCAASAASVPGSALRPTLPRYATINERRRIMSGRPMADLCRSLCGLPGMGNGRASGVAAHSRPDTRGRRGRHPGCIKARTTIPALYLDNL